MVGGSKAHRGIIGGLNWIKIRKVFEWWLVQISKWKTESISDSRINDHEARFVIANLPKLPIQKIGTKSRLVYRLTCEEF